MTFFIILYNSATKTYTSECLLEKRFKMEKNFAARYFGALFILSHIVTLKESSMSVTMLSVLSSSLKNMSLRG